MSKVAFVGSYTGFTAPGQLGWVGTPNPGVGISAFSFDDVTGKLVDLGKHVAQDSPTWLEVDPTKQYLVAVHELSHHTDVPKGEGWLTSYKIERDAATGAATGNLAKICTAKTGGNGNTAVTFDTSGKFLFTTRYWEGGVSILPFDPATGQIGEAALHQHEGKGPHPLRQSAPHPHGIHGDHKSNMVFALDLGTDMVHQYTLDTAKGALVPHATVPQVQTGGEGSGPRGINFHPTLRVAYVNCELNGTVVTCTITEAAGLVPVQTLPAYPDGFAGQDHPQNYGKAAFWGAEACITSDGKWYCYICRVHQSIAVFSVSAADGTLTFKHRVALADHSNARNMDLHESSAAAGATFLLVASQDADAVEVFTLASDDGTLTRVDTAAAACAADVAVV